MENSYSSEDNISFCNNLLISSNYSLKQELDLVDDKFQKLIHSYLHDKLASSIFDIAIESENTATSLITSKLYEFSPKVNCQENKSILNPFIFISKFKEHPPSKPPYFISIYNTLNRK